MAFDFKNDFRRASLYLVTYMERLRAEDARWRSAKRQTEHFFNENNIPSVEGEMSRASIAALVKESRDEIEEELERFDRVAKEESEQFQTQEKSEERFKMALEKIKEFVEKVHDSNDINGVNMLKKVIDTLEKEEGTHEDLVANDELLRLVSEISAGLTMIKKRIATEARAEAKREHVRPLK